MSLGRVGWDAVMRFNDNYGFAMAGFVAFSALLSIFPFMIFATTLISLLLGPTETERIVSALFEIAPEHVARTLEPVLHDVLASKSGQALTLSAVFAIWVASNAVEAIRVAFDKAYNIMGVQNFFLARLRAIILVFLGTIVAALLGFSIILSPLLIRLAEDWSDIQIPNSTAYLTYGFGVIVFVGFVFVLHRVLPGRHISGAKLWPGVLVTTLLWIIAAWGFSTYLSFAPSYTVTYGTLAGVIITLMFFYITGATIIFGAEFNASVNRVNRT